MKDTYKYTGQINWKIYDRYSEHSYGSEFESKLKSFFSLEDGHVRRSGRTTLLAKVLVEVAVESERDINIFDHFLDVRGGRPSQDEIMKVIDYRIQWFRNNDCPIGVRKLDRQKGIISLFVQPEFKSIYDYLRIKPFYFSNNPFPEEALLERIKSLNKYKLLLIC